jgi:hypothetical protein
MLRALLYLRLMSLKNLVLSRLRRLRQPKYLFGAVVAAAYLYFFVFRQARGGFRPGGAAPVFSSLPADSTPLFLGFGALALLVIVLLMWIGTNDQPGFRFTEAEIAFLFPAPIRRRGLMHYKLVGTLLASLLQTVFFALIFSGRAVLTGRAGYILAGWWVVLSFISLHYLGASLTVARLAERGVNARTRRLVLTGGAVTVAAAIGTWIWRTLPNVWLADSLPAWLQMALAHGALRWLLWPLQLLLRPFFATGPGEFLLALLPALALLALHYWWVIHTNVAFEEAAIAGAERRAARLAQLRQSGGFSTRSRHERARPDPFPLPRLPWPEAAFLWKNLLSTRRWMAPRTAFIAAALLVAGSTLLRRTLGSEYWRAGAVLASLGAIGAAATLFYGPLLSRLDLRRDLANADILKVYPLPGWRVVLGELLTPIVILGAMVWLGILAWFVGMQGHQPPQLPIAWFSPGMRVLWCLCAAALTPFLLALELLIPNAAPVLFPGWFQTLRTPGGGLDLMGQRLIFGFGQIFVVVLALALAAGGALAVHLMLRGAGVLVGWARHTGALGIAPGPSLVIATLVMVLVLAAEVLVGVRWVGRQFEQLDISEGRG